MMKKRNEGITLIALIITIIVMLILVGVTVSVALNGGLFSTAKYAANRTIEEKEKELIQVAYSDYNMKKYSNQKTEDFDMLETYFLGGEKQGLDISSLVDDEKTTLETTFFKNINISITDEDFEYSEDTLSCYIHFEYNNHKYKLTLNNENGMTKQLEVEPSLQVQDAVAIGDERKGWTIIFNDSSNTYELLTDGAVTSSTWWKLSKQEDEIISYDSDMRAYAIAKGENAKVGFINDKKDSIMIVVGADTTYFFVSTDSAKEKLEELVPGETIEKYKWYCSKALSEDTGEFKEYTGSSPISLSDFTNIISKSYLQKIIYSFK